MEAVYSGEFSQILEVLKKGPLLFLGGPLQGDPAWKIVYLGPADLSSAYEYKGSRTLQAMDRINDKNKLV